MPDKDSASYDKFFEDSLSKGSNVFVYLHGNTPSRATYYRVETYKVLQKLNFHVIAFDYRGLFWSTNVS